MLGYIKTVLCKHASHYSRISHLLTVDPDPGTVVDTLEDQLKTTSCIGSRHLKFGTVPVRFFPGVGFTRNETELLKVVFFVELI